MPRIPSRRTFSLLTVVLAVACTGGPTDLCGCSQVPPHAVLYGRVTDPAGAPVQNALVTAENGPAGCAEPLEKSQMRTAADGSYRAMVFAYDRGPGPIGCIRAFATPPEEIALRGSDTIPFAVRFDTGMPRDSARVDLVLRAP